MTTKRVRPRPNMIHVDMDVETKQKLDECVEYYRSVSDPLYTITEFIHTLIRNARKSIPEKKPKIFRN